MIVPLEPHHFQGWLVQYPDAVGFARLDENGAVVAIGALDLDEHGRVWAMFGGSAHPTDHRYALAMLQSLLSEGIAEIWAECDYSIPGAEKWLRRLGFEPVGEVWRWRGLQRR